MQPELRAPQRYYDVVIFGAGIVGCVTALLIRQCLPHLSVLLLDPSLAVPEEAEQQSVERYSGDALWGRAWRVSAVSLSVRAVLETLGLWEQVLASGVCPYHDMVVADAEGTGRFHLGAEVAGEACLGYLLENNVLLGCLRKACLADVGLHCLGGYALESVRQTSGDSRTVGQPLFDISCVSRQQSARSDVASVVSSFESSTVVSREAIQLSARLLIGVEGRESRLRKQLGLPVLRHDYAQSAIVCQVETEHPHDWTAWQDFLDTGPIAFLPLSTHVGFDPMQEMGWPVAAESERYCSIVWSLPSAMAQELVGPAAAEALLTRLNELAPSSLGTVRRCSVAAAFPLYGHLAAQAQQSGAVILGDAAHGYHPMAGQGLNVGVLDAAVLVDQLTLNFSRLGDFGHVSGLRRFERKRRFQQRALYELTTGLHGLYGRSEWWLRLGRNVGMRLFDAVPPLKKLLVQRANAHRIDLPERFRASASALPF